MCRIAADGLLTSTSYTLAVYAVILLHVKSSLPRRAPLNRRGGSRGGPRNRHLCAWAKPEASAMEWL